MMKLVWGMITDTSKLWVRIMKSKYACGVNSVPKFKYRANSTSTWKAIVSAWEDVQEQIIWVVCSGQRTRFWHDNWIPGVGVLADMAGIVTPEGESEFPIAHYALNGGWNWLVLQWLLPGDVCDKIAGLKSPSPVRDDFPCWNLTSNGFFSLKSAFELLQDPSHAQVAANPIFDMVWKWAGPNRIKALLWKISHDRLMTNTERKKRGMTSDDLCPRCHRCPETIMHLLRDCDEIRDLWYGVVDPDLCSKFFSIGLHPWLEWNLSHSLIGRDQGDWRIFFGVLVDNLWRDRNALVFSNLSNLGEHLLYQASCQTRFIIHNLQRLDPAEVRQPTRSIDVAWTPPPFGWFKINVDGSQ